ncbi:hypothetical protein COY88_02205 [Candidatus Roizmanbacteria bacterium CG_4_10_14_0_8_um_filter_35_28]|nr:MAG: hypothetical protein COX47_02995 [Candidatus Roizmanbacteria bacterium CG23_combo_of_CG06-09_8_20_14_all_35_49]PIY71103.1 MAG: hypothetical protein COY88_02205 [Candidatus Roizmanbacteria bacterium CG_4_10_14_0_8_um_filter_35_28]PJC84419.1 MAG: hypothetical protein CO006_00080 [Candidatus Roizmanbacteria bacterium CG_4_8_14_3_um_filter_35_14]
MKDDKSDAFFCAAIISLFALWRGFIMPPITRLPLNFFLLTVLYGSGTVFIYKALQYIEASEATILTASRSIITILSALIFLHVFLFLKPK